MEQTVTCSILTFCVRDLAMPTKNRPYAFFLTSSNILFTDGPVFNLENGTQEVYPGENVSLECSAEGNPPPEISWEYAPAVNAMAATRGHQRIITITGATSTNAGVYVCVAKSKAGRLTRSVTLLMKGVTIVP